MSRGIGITQRAILDALAAQPITPDPTGGEGWRRGLTSADLAGALMRSPAQVREACGALEQRGLVFIERGRGRRGGRRRVWLPQDYELKEASWVRFLGARSAT